MLFRKRSRPPSLFRLQEDGRFGVVPKHDLGGDLEQFVAIGDGSTRHGRGPSPMGTSMYRPRVRFAIVLVMGIAALFFGRSAQLQVVRGEHYQALSNRNKERVELVVPARGTISDRDGEPLAWNEPNFLLTMTSADLPDDEEERRVLFEQVSDLVGIHPTDLDLLLTEYAGRIYEAIPVVDGLGYEAAMRLAIEVSGLQGFELQTSTRRVYSSNAPSLSHVLGYTGKLSARDIEERAGEGYRLIDTLGKTGVESIQESLLRGVPGRLVYEVNASGSKLSILSKEDAVLGSNIRLSIDADLQKYIEQEMTSVFERVGASRGSVVAIDPRNGAIRAMVSLPTYDANEFIGGISSNRYSALIEDPDQPLFPRSVSGEFPSGSTFKPFVAYAALAEGIVGEHSSFLSTGGLRIGQWFFPDWKDGGHGITDARKAIAESVNTYFYVVGGGFDQVTGLGVERIGRYAERFGFGDVTGIDLPHEADGFLPSKSWKQEVKNERWYVGDTYHLSIGQGDFLTTPLQMAVGTAAIANRGKLVTPYVVESADGFGADTIVHEDPQPIVELDPYALTVVRQGMRQTVTIGSARSLSTLSGTVAGKTGTAQTIGDRPYHSWFTGFGPYNDPTLALVVLVEEGGGSNDAAVPLARSIYDWWFTLGD